MLEILAHIGFFGMFATLLWLPPLLVITLITPQKLLDKYFKEPHFNKGELIAFDSFPTFFMRTALFCRLYLTPTAVKGRKLYGFVEDSPKWYRVSVLIITCGLVMNGIFSFGLMGLVLLLD